mgnify:CR=1 FL=1
MTLEFCQALPKVDLHAHINGSIRLSTLRELAAAATSDAVERERMLQSVTVARDDNRTLEECFAIFKVIHAVVRTPDIVQRIAMECVLDFAYDGCRYLELRSTPRRDVMTARQYVKAVEDGIQAAQDTLAENAITVRLLLSINRAQSVANAEATVDLAIELASRPTNKYIVGVELSGNPFEGRFADFQPALTRARQAGLPVAVHAGEVDNDAEMDEVLDFRPDRLGHALWLNKQHVQRIIKNRIPVEICPTSNRLTLKLKSFAEHPTLGIWLQNTHPISLCTDDSGVFQTTLSREYFVSAKHFSIGRQTLFGIVESSIASSFVDPTTKSSIHEEVQHARTDLECGRHL